MAISGWGVFLIVLFVLLAIGGVGYFFFVQFRARQLGLAPPNLNPFARNRRETNYRPPAPASGGIGAWLSDKWHSFQTSRNSGGAYESTGYGGARASTSGRRGFGPLDPDEAWDSRVDHETSGYYEEQELGLQDPGQGPYGGSGYGASGGFGGLEEARGRSGSRQRELDHRYEEEMHAGGKGPQNPFADDAEPSSSAGLRQVSPRPAEEAGSRRAKRGGESRHSVDDNHGERRSVFHEDV